MKQKQIERAVIMGASEQSKLPESVLNQQGWTSHKIKHFLNNLMETEKPIINYLEIGAWSGSTFVAALYGNNLKNVYSIDNDYKEPDFSINTKDFKFKKIECDCWEVDLSLIKHKINIYFYDANHEYEDQYKALEYYYPVLAKDFIFIVDDYDWEKVSKGTQAAIKDLGLDVKFGVHLPSKGMNDASTWWNGLYIAHLKKTR